MSITLIKIMKKAEYTTVYGVGKHAYLCETSIKDNTTKITPCTKAGTKRKGTSTITSTGIFPRFLLRKLHEEGALA